MKFASTVVGLHTASPLGHLLLQRIKEQNHVIERQAVAIEALTERVEPIERLGKHSRCDSRIETESPAEATGLLFCEPENFCLYGSANATT